ncbi:secretion regulating guanine nucleotide exchange factor [Phyllostomus discolor]|uniref:Secretion regulating guanine nucleotide exchange factor n=1 Tax=Phyllostomus discolor TaxID=89673 RepID=A0A834A0X0_9CHIR|nr:secretion regulating guanine nucleotide exchange factor [Phyllostomus discolor]
MFCFLHPANRSLAVPSDRWPVAGTLPLFSRLLREKVVSIAAGLRHALAATASGIVFQWGTGLASSGRRLCPGQTLPLFLTAKEPSRVTGLENSKAICVAAGSEHSASLTDAGELYVWGCNKHGQLAAQAAFLPVPQEVEAHCFQSEKVTAVWSGWTHLVAQTETGKVFTWGRADYGQLGRKLESPEGRKPEKQGPPLRCLGPQKSTPSCLHCLTGATEAGPAAPGAGTSTACAAMAAKPTSGPRSPCRLCGRRRCSSWAAGPATPWPSASCLPALPQWPVRTPNLRKPRRDNQHCLPQANPTGAEMGGL